MLDRLPELIEKIDMAGFGQVSWDELVADLGNRVPGSFLAMFGTDPHNLRSQRVVVHRLDPSLIRSYATHYHAINPWNRFWQDPVPVKSTLQLMPSASLRHSEFVQDYLREAGGCYDSVGLRIDGEDGLRMNFSWGLHWSLAETQEADVVRLAQSVRSALIRAVRVNARLSGMAQGMIGAAGLAARSGETIFVIDQDRRLLDADPVASAALVQPGLVRERFGRLDLAEPSAARWLRVTLGRLHNRAEQVEADLPLRWMDKIYRLSLLRLPDPDRGLFLAKRSLCLLLVKDLKAAAPNRLAAMLAQMFGLLPSEIRVCECLLEGMSVSEIADRFANSEHTIRTHLKVIFHKTGTSRQAELVILLTRLG